MEMFLVILVNGLSVGIYFFIVIGVPIAGIVWAVFNRRDIVQWLQSVAQAISNILAGYG